MTTGNNEAESSVPSVANRHWFHGKQLPLRSVYIGRGTPLGNPFTVQAHGTAALEMYRRWLWDKIKTKDPKVMAALSELQPDHVLICSCKPRPCHGDVIQSAWIWMRDQGLLPQPQPQPSPEIPQS